MQSNQSSNCHNLDDAARNRVQQPRTVNTCVFMRNPYSFKLTYGTPSLIIHSTRLQNANVAGFVVNKAFVKPQDANIC